MVLNIPVKGNKRLASVLKRVRSNKRLATLWKCSNINAVDRLGYNDHGPVHVAIVANAALKMMRLLIKGKVKPDVVEDHGMENEDAEVVVVLAALLHDIGMSIHRHNHELFSMILAPPLLEELLGDYTIEERTILSSEVIHAIPHYSEDLYPFTIEAGVVRVADALDMSKGRSRIPFESGEVNIHSVSAQAIENVDIRAGKKKPIVIIVEMSNSAGIFQLDVLLKPRIEQSGLAEHITVRASVQGKEKHIVKTLEI